MSLFARWTAVLDALRAEGRYRRLALPRGVDLTSNDYLGYAAGRLPLAVEPNLPLSGTASRLLRGHHPIWEEVEDRLARWHGAEAALVMTSGYLANEGLLSTVIEPADWVASDESNHASLIDGLRLNRPERFVYRHNDLGHLEAGLHAAARRRPAGRELFVVTESLFSMEGDRAPLRELAELADRYGAHLIVDEAHATGCLGPAGSGCVDAAGLRGRVLATTHTGGKALGVPGAYLCVPARLKEYLINRCRHLIFTTAPPPAAGAWWLAAVARCAADDAGRSALRDNTTTFRTALARGGLTAAGEHYIVPVILGGDARAVRVAERVQRHGFDVRAIRPPTVPAGTARLRISIHAGHDPAVLTDLARVLAEALAAS